MYALRNIAFISEHPDAFPGVTCEERSTRTYPYGALAAHVLGYTGTVSDRIKEIKEEVSFGIEHPITNLGFEQFGLDSGKIE